jgi:hypothetical protein
MGFFKWVSKQVNNVVKAVTNVVTKTVQAIGNTVKAIIKNPLPVLAQIAGSAIGIPPYVTSAAITALQGGNLSDIAKGAALSYAGSQISGQIGSSSIGSATASAGQSVTQSLMASYPSLATAAGTAVTAGLNAGIIGAGSAALMGKDVAQGALQGFTSGATSSAATSYFKSVQPDWGISNNTVKTLGGLTGAVTTAEIFGQNSQTAASNYLANNAVQSTLNSAKETIQDSYAIAKDYFAKAQLAEDAANAEVSKAYEIQKTFDIAKASHDAAVADYQKKADDFNAQRDVYQQYVNEYNRYMQVYNDPNSSVDQKNRAAATATTFAESANAMYPSLQAKQQEVDAFQKNLSDPTYAINKQFIDASTEFSNQIEIAKKAADETKLLQDQAVKAATDAETADKTYQQELETATDNQTTTEDEVNKFFQDNLGRDASPEEVAAYVGDKLESDTLNQDLAQKLQQEQLDAEKAERQAKASESGVYVDENGVEQWLPEVTITAPPETNFLDEYGDVNYDDTNYKWDGSFQTPDDHKVPTKVTYGEKPSEPNTLPATIITASPETYIDENGTEQWILPELTADQPNLANPTKPTDSTKPTGTTTSPLTPQPTAKPQYVAPVMGALQTVAQEAPAPLKPTGLTASGLTTKGKQEAFIDPLAPLQQVMAQSDLISNNQPQTFPVANQNQLQNNLLPQLEEQPDMLEPFYNYGSNQSIDDIMGGGGQSSFAEGGLAGTRYGKYAAGGMPTPLMAAGGKMRVDFRHGDAVTGAGDGQSDDIPAMLADGEFVFPADVVAAIGNGSTKAGSDKLYDMMHGIRAHVRSATPKDLPPVIKSPLDFLKPKKARR